MVELNAGAMPTEGDVHQISNGGERAVLPFPEHPVRSQLATVAVGDRVAVTAELPDPAQNSPSGRVRWVSHRSKEGGVERPSPSRVSCLYTVEINSDRAELEDLFVDPEWQRQGIARQLVGGLVDNARRRGFRTILVTGNPHALRFYLAVGFVVLGDEATELGAGTRLALDLT